MRDQQGTGAHAVFIFILVGVLYFSEFTYHIPHIPGTGTWYQVSYPDPLIFLFDQFNTTPRINGTRYTSRVEYAAEVLNRTGLGKARGLLFQR